MKVLFDHSLFCWQKYGGASKYFTELWAHMPQEEWDTTLLFSNNAYLEAKRLFPFRHFFSRKAFWAQPRLMHELTKPYAIYKLLKNDYDIFHESDTFDYCLPFLRKKPMVMTFHDINFSTYKKNVRIEKRQRHALERADRVITVSLNTKKDLMAYWNYPEEKIAVIYHGVDQPIAQIPSRLYDFPYVLYVGTRNTHKNFERFVRAFGLLHTRYPELRMVCTRNSFTAEEMQWLREAGVSSQAYWVAASESVMASLYYYAEMFVFPSYYEGFGMPILEAMQYGCPVVLAQASCFPEIAGDAGLYFDPFDIESQEEAMEKVLSDSELKSSLIQKGRCRAAEFSWQKCADEHRRLYRSMIE